MFGWNAAKWAQMALPQITGFVHQEFATKAIYRLEAARAASNMRIGRLFVSQLGHVVRKIPESQGAVELPDSTAPAAAHNAALALLTGPVATSRTYSASRRRSCPMGHFWI